MARFGDIARALGDVRASMAVARFVNANPEVPGSSRVVSGSGGPVASARIFTDFAGDAPLEKLRASQLAVAAKISSCDDIRAVHTIAGVDVSYDGDRGFATAVVLRYPDLAVVERAEATREIDFPYIPTYLSQREFPIIRDAIVRLETRPSVLLVDGHGRLHPARCGIACLVGVRLGLRTIGVAKNPLSGTMQRRPGIGESVPVRVEGEILGYALRASSSARPLFVSVGHRVSLRTAVRIVRRVTVMRNPEPLRLAHVLATEQKRRKEERKKDSKRVRDSLPT